jgi:hypothetical protein
VGFEPDMYFWIAVIGFPVLILLLTGPGMWSEKWGWKTMDRIGHWFDRLRSRKPR